MYYSRASLAPPPETPGYEWLLLAATTTPPAGVYVDRPRPRQFGAPPPPPPPPPTAFVRSRWTVRHGQTQKPIQGHVSRSEAPREGAQPWRRRRRRHRSVGAAQHAGFNRALELCTRSPNSWTLDPWPCTQHPTL